MAFNSKSKFDDKSNFGGVVDIEVELASALGELKKTKKKNIQLKEQLLRAEKGMYHFDNEYFNLQKVKIEEVVKLKDILVQKLKEKHQSHGK